MSFPLDRRRVLSTGTSRVWIWRALLLVALLRIGAAAHSGLTYTRGDFYATLPGAHVRELNPALWNSPDLAHSWAFQRDEYLYGPTQFLTLYPLSLFDSYKDIALFLLILYGLLLLVAGGAMVLALNCRRAGAAARAALIAGTALYLPLLQAYVQREFETVVVILLALAMFAVVTRRKWLAGLVIGYVTWFKFFPIVFLLYFIAKGWWRAVAGFVAASVIVLGATHVAFDLRRFAPVLELVRTSTETALSMHETCYEWLLRNETFASVRYGLCRLGGPESFALLEWVFWVAVGLALYVFGRSFLRVSGTVVREPAEEQMRRMLEFSFVVALSAGVFYGHYYYLAQLVIPINVLIYRYTTPASAQRVVKANLLAIVYLLLTAFVVPPSLTTTVLGVDAWRFYMQHALYLYGQTLLIALLLWEYTALVNRELDGGGRGIRTPGTLSGTTVFKTAAINHSAIPPLTTLQINAQHDISN